MPVRVAALVFFLVGVSVLISGGCDGPPGGGGSAFATGYDPEFRLPSFAIHTAETVLKPLTNDPATAQFCPLDAVRIGRLPNIEDNSGVTMRRWFVHGILFDSNQFGALLRETWTMEVVYQDERFVPVAATLEGREIFRLSGYSGVARIEPEPGPEGDPESVDPGRPLTPADSID